MSRKVKKHIKKKEQALSKAIDNTAGGLTEVASGLIGGLISAGAEYVKEFIFSEDEEDDD